MIFLFGSGLLDGPLRGCNKLDPNLGIGFNLGKGKNYLSFVGKVDVGA